VNGRLTGVLGMFGVLAAASALAAGPTVLPSLQRTAATSDEALPISRSTPPLVCPGPETLLVPDGGIAVDPGGPVLVSALVGSASGPSSARLQALGRGSAVLAAGASRLSGLGPAPVAITQGRSLTLTADQAGPKVAALAVTALGPALLRAAAPTRPSRQAELPAVAAVQSTLVRSGDLRALVATTCGVPEAESWLVGGATGDGERLRLLLANPAATAAVVDVDVHGPTGRVRAPSGEGVVVPAGGEVPIFIDALAPGLKQVAVHVTTRSGRVRATLHDSRLRGLDPGGADDVPVGAAPAKRQVIPGVSLVDGFGRTAEDPTAAGSTAVRVAVPGAEEAVVRVRLMDASGAVELPRASVVNVPAGGVADVPVAGVDSGTYTAIVESDVPVVAGALVGRGGVVGTAPASEFAWAPAARPLTGPGYVMLPPGSRSALSLVAAEDAGRLSVSEVRTDGSVTAGKDVDVPAGTSITVPLGGNTVAVRIDAVSTDPGSTVAASVVSWASDPRGSLISVLTVNLSAPADAPHTATQDRTLGLP